MLGDKWITDRTPTERFPDYTRANAGEVLADPVSPLGWTFCWESGVVLGCRDGFVSYGVFDADEYGNPPETFGLFGGYFYNSLTQSRLMGVRMPGATPEAIDEAYFDDHPDVPPYQAKDWHESAEHEEKLGVTAGYLTSIDTHAPIDEQKVIAKQLRDARPDLSALTPAELVARAREVQPQMVANFEQHVWASLGASVGPGILAALLPPLGREADVVPLLTGVGDVDSADIARELWVLSRMVRNSAELTAAFEAGVDGLAERVAGTEFETALQTFLYNHGGRGPNEWDPAADSYETRPAIAFGQLDAMRRQTDDADPVAALQRNSARRNELIEEIGAMVAGDEEAAGMFAAANRAAAAWMAARERSKTSNIRVIHEARMAFHELGRRMVADGHIAEPSHIYMVLEAELDAYIADPASFSETIAERAADFAQLADLIPPFIVNGTCPPLAEWERRGEVEVDAVSVGDALEGVACSPGVVTAVARVILDPTDASALEPGEIMVTENTDPSWTPLFLAAGAVVTNVGAVASHASIVSRELGIPCVASVPNATLCIPDGATVTVDGALGTVTIDALP